MSLVFPKFLWILHACIQKIFLMPLVDFFGWKNISLRNALPSLLMEDTALVRRCIALFHFSFAMVLAMGFGQKFPRPG